MHYRSNCCNNFIIIIVDGANSEKDFQETPEGQIQAAHSN